jgi:hypothetical protein
MYYASDFISNETYSFETKEDRDNWVNANSSCRIKTGFRMVQGQETAILEKTIAHVRAGLLNDHPTFHRAQIVKHHEDDTCLTYMVMS